MRCCGTYFMEGGQIYQPLPELSLKLWVQLLFLVRFFVKICRRLSAATDGCPSLSSINNSVLICESFAAPDVEPDN